MHTIVVGAGPAGLFTAISLARRGRSVLVVDRDPGPTGPDEWRRRGVMQFAHSHTFRAPAIEALQQEIPDALVAMRRAGATIATATDGAAAALRIRREVFERVLRDVASAQRRLTMVTGHVDAVLTSAGRAVGVRVGGAEAHAGLVIDASGRTGRALRDGRVGDGTGRRAVGMVEGSPCGAAYVSRQYRLRDGADPGPVNSPIGLSLTLRGYFAVMFLHEGRTFSVTITHGGTDSRLHRLRHPALYEAAVRAIPGLAEWIDPARAEPLTPVLPGGRLYNTYRAQVDGSGQPVLPGLVAVGDAVCTTTPLAGRGVSLAFLQARRLVEILAAHRDPAAATVEFDAWCRTDIRPWYLDHVAADGDRLRRWSGGDVDLTRPLPSDLVVAAAAADPGLGPAVAPYDRMSALPSSLDAPQARARAVYASGWRPPVADGPTAEDLAQLCGEADDRGRLPAAL
ncbi:flavin-dependent dehydrogenase [Mycolicibacterium iranicum]|uniref:Flavin-dependent dehydrogenase n=1 Tax=Mycolicibacterium iranicum TaxID=912594 RepID=A0A839QAR4_MYCIR|nr:FAD-dependent oxidoreductase [Mycolicibacterium iranicum]MBB2992707.1 flavin-dependent dehydrogenase [Mycolicibacterium iranicum]